MNTFNRSLQTHTSPVTELLAAMYRVVNHEQIIEIKEHKEYASHEVEKWVKDTRSSLSAELVDELNVFFHKESYLGLTLIPELIRKKVYHDFQTFLAFLQKLPINVMFEEFMHSGFGPDRKICDLQNPKEVIDFIEKLNLPREEKWKLAYLIFDAERTKQRFITLVQSFYFKYFQEFEAVILEKQIQFQHQLSKGSSTIIEEMFKKKLGMEDAGETQLIIFPSYFLDTSSIILLLFEDEYYVSVLGIQSLELIKAKRDDKETLEAIKVLIDERRFQLLQILKKQPSYGYELAQQLGVSNSTISHHLSSLISQKFVRAIRKENKVYYEVNVNEIKDIIDRFKNMLIDH